MSDTNISLMTKDNNRIYICILAVSILITAFCAIVYQFLISTLSSYLFGSSVFHFSLTIGIFMFFMGVGSYLSRFCEKDLLDLFISVEIGIGFVGGIATGLLFLSYSLSEYYYLCAFLLIAVISTFIGLEIPIVTRILREYSSVKDALANILAFDYFGALVASILFPIVLLPYLGLMKTGFMVGVF